MLRPYIYLSEAKPEVQLSIVTDENGLDEIVKEFPKAIFFYDEDDMELFLAGIRYKKAVDLLKYALHIRVNEEFDKAGFWGSQRHWDASCEAFMRSIDD